MLYTVSYNSALVWAQITKKSPSSGRVRIKAVRVLDIAER
jgi:hypothetical protein